MAFVAFVGSVLVTGIVGACIPNSISSSHMEKADYHYVPYAGDVFGA
ncbi:MAG: hypothetical protein IKG18_13080 [Atopobiaceae bacterium]|nr:hypothetical protein [Atopobiaceae bacterium]